MGVCVYRDGNTYEIRGIKCERIVINSRSVKGHIQAGWRLTPEKDAPVEEVVIADEPDDAELHPAVAERKKKGRKSRADIIAENADKAAEAE